MLRRSRRARSLAPSAGDAEEEVVGFGLADGDADAVAGERTDGDALGLHGFSERQSLITELEPDEVGLRLRNVPTGGTQRVDDPGSLDDQRADPLEQLF